jgi:hypothetical protein
MAPPSVPSSSAAAGAWWRRPVLLALLLLVLLFFLSFQVCTCPPSRSHPSSRALAGRNGGMAVASTILTVPSRPDLAGRRARPLAQIGGVAAALLRPPPTPTVSTSAASSSQ